MMRRCGLILLVGVLFCAATLRDLGDDWIDATQLPVTLSEVSPEIRDRHGALLRAYPVGDGLWRMAVRVDQVDPDFITMLVRFEDKRFWHHAGVDPLAMMRAMGQALWSGRVVSGGSTLSMQVARLLEDGSTGTWSGKVRQMRVAMALERRLNKAEILKLYLTHAPYGANLEGVRAASIAWFAKEPRRLTPAQSALLVALPQSPQARRPDRAPDAARKARNRVLQRMAAQGVLPQTQASAAMSERLPHSLRPFPRLAPHLSDRLRRNAPLSGHLDLTVDRTVQRKMEKLIGQSARRAGERLSAALIVADHTTGEIIASVGSPSYGGGQGRQGYVDMTRALRAPGSVFKPLVSGLAFDQGLAHPETLIHDGPVDFNGYAPRNFDGAFRGDVRIRDALQLSLNIPVVMLTDALGPARLMAALRASGAQASVPGGQAGLAVALGGLGVSLHDLVQLYAGLAQGGRSVALYSQNSDPTPDHTRLMAPEAAWHVGHILSGLAPPPGAPTGALAYKTGTSYGHRDAWAIGFDGQHVIGVWLGRADGTPVPGAFGGDLAAPVLFEAFGRLKPEIARLPPPPPSTLMVSSADLPPPLRQFRGAAPLDIPSVQLTFPPDGARLALDGGPLTLKLRGGTAPYLVLADGRPLATGQRHAEFEISNPGLGFSTLVVVDAQGRSDRVRVRID
ncbi:MAG: penicillin-binding protein 1C [Sedimentitalea sp.]